MEAILQETERAFESLSKSLFNGTLKIPTVVFMPQKKGVIRFVAEDDQLVVGCDIAKVDVTAFLAHMLHEMVHVQNYQKGVVDSREGQYHNAKFRDAALAVGLTVDRSRSHGWGQTSFSTGAGDSNDHREPLPLVVERREEAIKAVNFDRQLFQNAQKKVTTSRKRTFFLKYECQCAPPHNSIRSGRRPDGDHPLNIKCLDCGSPFKCVDL